jgi:hypothetical protein
MGTADSDLYFYKSVTELGTAEKNKTIPPLPINKKNGSNIFESLLADCHHPALANNQNSKRNSLNKTENTEISSALSPSVLTKIHPIIP